MIPFELPAKTGEELLRVLRALGAHRYVAGRAVLVHALAFDALQGAEPSPASAEALAWAAGVLDDPSIDHASKDERLYRRATPDEVAAVLEGFWGRGPHAGMVHDRLLDRLAALELDWPLFPPFDDRSEDEVHPVLIDAGWELLPLAELDAERHKGAIQAFDEPILFEAARFEEENAIPPVKHLQELPVFGPVELVRGLTAEGDLVEPVVLWIEGNATYHDYVLRGVLKAAKIEA